MQMVTTSSRPFLISEAAAQERAIIMVQRIFLYAIISLAAWYGDSVALAARDLNNQRPTEVRTVLMKKPKLLVMVLELGTTE